MNPANRSREDSGPPSARAPELRTARRVLFATSLGSFLAPFGSSALSFSVPEIGGSLGVSFLLMVWVPLAYLIPLATSMVLFGKLSDTFGRTRLFLIGFLLYGLGSVAAFLSTSFATLVAPIVIMGTGAALLSVNSTALVTVVFPSRSRGGALGIVTMAVYIGLTGGPTLSGVLLGLVGWRSLFYTTAALAFVSLLVAARFLRHVEAPRRPSPLDLRGFLTFLTAIFLIVFALSAGEVYRWASVIPLFAIGFAMLALFVLLERRREHPLLELSLFTRNRTFAAANATAFLNYVSTFAIVFVFSIYFTVIAGLSTIEAGLLLVVEPVLMVAISPVSGRLSDRVGARGLASLGMLIISIAFFSLYFVVGRVPPIDLTVPLAVVGVGFGLFSAPNTNSVMGSVDRELSGMAAGTLGTMRFIGQLMSIAVTAALLASAMPHSALLGLFSGASTSSASTDTGAFLSGLRTIMVVSGVLSLAGVVTSLVREAGLRPSHSGSVGARDALPTEGDASTSD